MKCVEFLVTIFRCAKLRVKYEKAFILREVVKKDAG